MRIVDASDEGYDTAGAGRRNAVSPSPSRLFLITTWPREDFEKSGITSAY
jgi:hypothetical protein